MYYRKRSPLIIKIEAKREKNEKEVSVLAEILIEKITPHLKEYSYETINSAINILKTYLHTHIVVNTFAAMADDPAPERDI